MSTEYAHPEMLVSTDWVAEHTGDPNVKIVEVDVDTASYDKGHIRNAIGWNWQTDLNDRIRRDVIDPRTFAELNRAAGIRRPTRSSSTATTTTGLPPGLCGNSNITATKTSGS